MERFHAFVKPMSPRKRLTRENVVYAISGMWIFSTLFCTPSYLAYRHDGDEKCLNIWGYKWAKNNKVYLFYTLAVFLVPAFISIFYCYLRIVQGMYFTNEVLSSTSNGVVSREDARSKKRLTTMFETVTLTFFISYSPLMGMSIYGIVSDAESWKKRTTILTILQDASWLLIFAGCSLNPFLYHFQSKNYRNGFRKMFHCQYNFNERNMRHKQTK